MDPPKTSDDRRAWWREAEFWLVVGLVAATFASRINTLPLHGEEPRRAMVAVEMAENRDWLVPRQQGFPYFSRPPLQNWLVGACLWAFDSRAPWVPRVPSVVAVVLTSALIYAYARQFLGRLGALAAGLAYPTGGAILVSGADAETEPVFVLFLAGALLVWHWGYDRGWGTVATWVPAYALAGLAALTKGGLQPAVYLCGATGLYLLWKRDVWFALSFGHVLGVMTGLGVVAAWTVPYANEMGWFLAKATWLNNTTSRMAGWKASEVAAHLGVFPVEAFGCLLPWGILAAGLVVPRVRRAAAGVPCVGFCVCALAVAFPTCWIPPLGQTRYLYPVFPCAAILAGVVVDRLAADPELMRAGWRWFLTGMTVLAAAAAVAVPAGLAIQPGSKLDHLRPTVFQAVGYAATLGMLARVIARGRRDLSPAGLRTAVVAVAVATAVLITGVMTDVRARRANDIAAGVAPVRERLGPGAGLVSLGSVPHSFRFHYPEPIPMLPPTSDLVPPGGYFCFWDIPAAGVVVPFEWAPVARVSLDRTTSPRPQSVVVVGRRVAPR